jgi:S-adenosylmethionine:diacylglycerol 3-amino-3-carboxypropyl transferase
VSWSRRLFARVNALVSPIAFSITLDDHRTVSRALRPLPGDRVLCLASAGDTPLNLLVHDPAEVVAVDLALPQLHLARLKTTAVATLTLADLHFFLGVRGPGRDPAQRRLGIYRTLRACLDPETRRFWDDHHGMLRRGVLWQGAVQRIAPFGGPVVRLRRVLAGASWSVAGNPYLAPLLSRRMPAADLLPPYLAPRTHPVVQARAGRIRFERRGVREALRDAGPGFDCLALSNVADWLSRDQVDELLADISVATRPNGRVLLWSRRRRLRTSRPLPRALAAQPALQRRLRRTDRIGYLRAILVLRRNVYALTEVAA